MPLTAYIWPCDTWCWEDEYEDIEYTHMSDDFATVTIEDDILTQGDEIIEQFIYNYNH